MFDDDDLKFWVAIGGIFLAILFFSWGIVIFDCKTYKESTGKEVKIEWGTCYVKTGGEWFSKDQIRGVK